MKESKSFKYVPDEYEKVPLGVRNFVCPPKAKAKYRQVKDLKAEVKGPRLRQEQPFQPEVHLPQKKKGLPHFKK